MLDTSLREPNQPGWWLERLSKALRDRQPTLKKYEDYYCGNHPLAYATEKFRVAFGGLFSSFADNWTALVVDACGERLNVEGFRIPDDESKEKPETDDTGEEPQEDAVDELYEGDEDAWDIWQANNLDAESEIAHTEALKLGISYGLVWPDADFPRITPEHPSQMITAAMPGSRHQTTAALKMWLDDDGYLYGFVYLSDALYKFRSAFARKSRSLDVPMSGWVPYQPDGEPWPLPHPFGRVPVVPFYNRPGLVTPYESEIANVIPMQDAVTKTVLDMLVASEYAAYKQRWATGFDIPVDPDTNEKVEPFKHAVQKLWINERPEGQFGEFSESDLGNYVKAIELLVQHVASQTRTPPHYFYLSGQFPSGESLRAAETGLVAKAKRKMRHFGESWEDVIRLAFKAMGDPRGEVRSSETIWADPETKTLGELADYLIKLDALGVPQEILWSKAGLSPVEIRRAKLIKAKEPKPPEPGIVNTLDKRFVPGVAPSVPMPAPASGGPG